MPQKVRIGVVGCGKISGAYLGMAKNFPLVELVACSDMNLDVAKAKAAEYGVPKACSVDDLLADKSIDIVLNLTVPKAHVPISLAAINAGKHTYLEKPLGINREEGMQLLAAAKAKNLRVGCAPDTFMGAGIQTARKLIDDGAIGRPVSFEARMLCGGHESWHPSPEFYYEAGGGPMFDMGPYYLTALLNLLGPVKRYSGLASTLITDRSIGSGPKQGKKFPVETPDHILGLLEFQSGTTGTLATSFAVRCSDYNGKQPITIYGTEGTLRVPDPNHFDGVVSLKKVGEKEFTDVPFTHPTGYGRSVGLAEMAHAIQTGKPHRASGEQANLVLDLMQGFLDSSAQNRTLTPTQPYTRHDPMPAGSSFGQLD